MPVAGGWRLRSWQWPRIRPGSKRLEIQFAEPHEHLAVDMFSRRFQIEPKAFIEKMRELDMEVCTLI